jgi:hypothetical protein
LPKHYLCEQVSRRRLGRWDRKRETGGSGGDARSRDLF